MDEMPSSKFRRRYASLTKLTIVTANGHIIGQWTPAGHSVSGGRIEVNELGIFARPTGPPFNSRPFTPAPKKGK